MAVATPTAAFPAGDSPWTRAQAERLLRIVEDMFHRRDVEALVNGFTEDCVFRLIAEWDAAFNVWPRDGERPSAIM
jgi:hypothetical protein